MRVLLVTSFPIPGEYDGTAMLPIKILRALKTRGVDVVLAHLKARPTWGDSSQTEFEGTPSFTFHPRDWVGGLAKVHREFPFDLVHAQHHGGANRAYLACRKYRWPMVYELHSLLGEEYERDRLGRGLGFQVNLRLERAVCRHAAAVIVLGEQVKRVMIEEKGVPADRVTVIYPGIDLGEYERSGSVASIPGVDPGHKVVMYVGSIIHPNQGVPLLIESLPVVFEAVPEARCVLVGGPAEAGIRYQSELGRFGDRLITLTGQTPEEVVSLTRRADVLVHSRLACRENYSVQSKIAVYLAAGRPIVATDFADYATLLGPTGAGRLASVDSASIAEAIIDVLTHPELASRLAASTRAVAVEHFGMDRNIDRYLEVYRKALREGPR
ncbi:glycosyltransferase family 4 protein [Tundrisphaera lichenicola]|uniref:glycosyltransferase family 4 protein n=1 Tax=Tundrisphaera lichenicola TaxID=2029860 RepID=UPI003EBD6A07